MRLRASGLLAVLALVAASCGGGSPEGAGPSEGIQVHGDWTIDIYNEDGTLDRRVEFSNALWATGARTIASVLAGETTIGVWGIDLEDSANELCPSGPDVTGACWIPVTADFSTAEDVDGDLSEETLRLTGSIEIEVDGSIDIVNTNVGTCEPSTAPTGCAPVDRSNTFTSRFLDDPIPVSAGQQVQAQVDISFTSG